jgi:murein DD-endopeptidase MepM/ murein hydrolase activator NlpD
MLPLLVALVLVIGTPASAASTPWRWPIPAPHPVLRPFLAPASPYASGHRGIDIGAATTAVYAPADGVVHFAGTVVDRPVLSIDHAGGLLSSYEPVVAVVSVGDAVTRGQLIGTLVSGHCASLCLHLGVRVNGEYISPLTLLDGVPLAVLLPTRTAALASASTRCALARAPPRRRT